MKSVVTVIRKWNNPSIEIRLSNDSLELDITLEDFLIALADEVAEPLVSGIAEEAGNPSFWFTKEAVTKNLLKAIEGKGANQYFAAAAERVINRIKQESVKAI